MLREFAYLTTSPALQKIRHLRHGLLRAPQVLQRKRSTCAFASNSCHRCSVGTSLELRTAGSVYNTANLVEVLVVIRVPKQPEIILQNEQYRIDPVAGKKIKS